MKVFFAIRRTEWFTAESRAETSPYGCHVHGGHKGHSTTKKNHPIKKNHRRVLVIKPHVRTHCLSQDSRRTIWIMSRKPNWQTSRYSPARPLQLQQASARPPSPLSRSQVREKERNCEIKHKSNSELSHAWRAQLLGRKFEKYFPFILHRGAHNSLLLLDSRHGRKSQTQLAPSRLLKSGFFWGFFLRKKRSEPCGGGGGGGELIGLFGIPKD